MDKDGDGYGDPSDIKTGCQAPDGYIVYDQNKIDCNDNNPSLQKATIYYADNDGDGYGAGSQIYYCSVDSTPNGYVLNNSDCNDNDKTSYLTVTFYEDKDGDGWGSKPLTLCTNNETKMLYRLAM